jgi:hypothetical protein
MSLVRPGVTARHRGARAPLLSGMTPSSSLKGKPIGVRDVQKIAVEIDVSPDTVARVLNGAAPRSRARQRVWEYLHTHGLADLIAPTAENGLLPATRG